MDVCLVLDSGGQVGCRVGPGAVRGLGAGWVQRGAVVVTPCGGITEAQRERGEPAEMLGPSVPFAGPQVKICAR